MFPLRTPLNNLTYLFRVFFFSFMFSISYPLDVHKNTYVVVSKFEMKRLHKPGLRIGPPLI